MKGEFIMKNRVKKTLTFEEYYEMQKIKLLSFKDYCDRMKIEYKYELEEINDELLTIDSFNRGQLLYNILEGTELDEELKYYVFLKWWSSIDSCNEKFRENVKRWLHDARVKLNFNNLNVDEHGYVKVYRGTNEYAQSWSGTSWTTDKYTALKFAEGARVRRPVESPAILIGRVHVDQILGMINDRHESEILCYYTEQDGVLYSNTEEYKEIKNGLEEHMIQIQKDIDLKLKEMIEKM